VTRRGPRLTPRHRIRVQRRRPHGRLAAEMALTGKHWSYWCTCNGHPVPFEDQPKALAAGLTHLAVIHGEATGV
jgi:hypothetical protein